MQTRCGIDSCSEQCRPGSDFCYYHDDQVNRVGIIEQADPAEKLKKAMCEWLDSVEERIKKMELEAAKKEFRP